MRARPTGRDRRPRSLPQIALLCLCVHLAAPGLALGGPLSRALDHLAARQDPFGGGFSVVGGTEPGYTTWAALAVASSGEDPGGWRRGEPSLRDALLAPAPGLGVGEAGRMAVATVAAGLEPRRAGGRNLVRRLLLARRGDGSIGDDVSTTSWAVLALTSAGLGSSSRPIVAARRAIERAQRPDGGWSTLDDVGPSALLTTADAVQALVAAGRTARTSPALRRARAFLRSAQNRDGGFPTVVGSKSTALTTAWVTLAIRALGERSSRPPWDRAGGPLALLARLQGRDGGVRNSAASRESSVWATSQAALAFAGKPLPLRVAPSAAPPSRTPRVLGRDPLGGGRVTGSLVVRFADDQGGTGIDPGSVRLRVDGRDVTARAAVTSSALTLPRAAVPSGRARVRLALTDRAGNTLTTRWRVVGPDR